MKYFSFLFVWLSVSSCHREAKEMLRLVNDQNDGWNAFTVSIFDDGTYKKEVFGGSETGGCSIKKDTVCFTTGRMKGEAMVFTRAPSECIYGPGLISHEARIDMRVIFDSLFCTGKFYSP